MENTSDNKRDSHQFPWIIPSLNPTPGEDWDNLLAFLNFSDDEKKAMRSAVEPLLKHSQQFVISNYKYLAEFPETAVILVWESGVDESHLAERRQFFAVWIGRLLGMDFSHELADYLFLAGQKHAGHGPRHVHVPPVYITGAVSHTIAWIADVLSKEQPGSLTSPLAIAGFQKLLSLHLQMMLNGYQTAINYTQGNLTIPVSFYGKMRTTLAKEKTDIHINPQSPVTDLLTKFFNYYPIARNLALETEWLSESIDDSRGNPWVHVNRVFKPRSGWRVLLNGEDIIYLVPEKCLLKDGDRVKIFPPGR